MAVSRLSFFLVAVVGIALVPLPACSVANAQASVQGGLHSRTLHETTLRVDDVPHTVVGGRSRCNCWVNWVMARS